MSGKDWYQLYENLNQILSGSLHTRDHEIYDLYTRAERHVTAYEDLLDEGHKDRARYELEQAQRLLTRAHEIDSNIDKFAELNGEVLEE